MTKTEGCTLLRSDRTPVLVFLRARCDEFDLRTNPAPGIVRAGPPSAVIPPAYCGDVDDWPEEWRAGNPSRVCPKCGASAVRPAMFGMPTMDVIGAVESGEISIVIGGCVLSFAPVSCGCLACSAMFVEASGGALIADDQWLESQR
jgi:hypothetical protein